MPGRPPNKAASGSAGAKSGTGRTGGYTMAEVARIAGVSAMTVSRALKHDGSVSPETRSKILKVIKRTGYVIDLTARSFGSGKSGFVAVLIPSLNNSNFADTASGISAGFEGSGLQLLLGSTEYELEREEHLIDTMLQRRPEALIIAGTVHTPRTIELLQNAPFPVVEIWELPPAPLQHVVGFSNAAASAAMVRHLHAKGYRHIGFIGGATFRDYRGGARRRGSRETLCELGLPEGPDLTFGHSPISTEEAAHAVAQMIEQWPEVDAVMCVADLAAFGALMECHRRGWKVPERLAIGGFGNFEIGRHTWPRITTVDVDCVGIGLKAAELVLRARAARDRGEDFPAETVITDFRVIERETT